MLADRCALALQALIPSHTRSLTVSAASMLVLFERRDVSDVVPLGLGVVAIRADRDADADCHVREVIVEAVRLKVSQIEIRIENGKAGLGAPSAVTGKGRVPAESALLLADGLPVLVLGAVVIHELEDPREHGQALGLTQAVLDGLDPTVVGTSWDQTVRCSLNSTEVNDVGQLAVVGSVLVRLRACVEGRSLLLFGLLCCLTPGGCRCCVAPLLSWPGCWSS